MTQPCFPNGYSGERQAFAILRRGCVRRCDMDRKTPIGVRDTKTGRQNNAAYKHPEYSDHQYHNRQRQRDRLWRRVRWLFCLSSRLCRSAIRQTRGGETYKRPRDALCRRNASDASRELFVLAIAMATLFLTADRGTRIQVKPELKLEPAPSLLTKSDSLHQRHRSPTA